MLEPNKCCELCGFNYRVKPSRVKKSRFCSNDCKNAYARKSQAGRPMPEGCRRKKSGPHTRLAAAKSCGHLTLKGRTYCTRCREKFYSKVESKACATCGGEMLLSPSQSKKYQCCSIECRNVQISEMQKGERSHLWKGGITDDNRRLRNSAKYDKWRRSVMERDDYTCQMCGQRGGNLCSDHIKAWSMYPALRFDIDNGRTLCLECHKKTPNFGHKAYKQMKSAEIEGTLQYRLV